MHGAPLTVDGSAPSGGPSLRDRPGVLVALLLSLLVTSIDHTIVNVALPELVRELGATAAQLQWIVDAYTIVFAGLLLTAGSLGDRFGRRRALRAGLALFAVGSVAAALAASPTGVIAGRAVMGVGGALIMPATLSILVNVFTGARERAQAITLWAAVSGLGIAVGPIVGGLVLRSFSWSSVFWINVPLLVGALIATQRWVRESKDPRTPRLDPVGALLSVAVAGGLVWTIIEAPHVGWLSGITIGRLVAALVLTGAFVAWEGLRREPMLDLRLLRDPRFSAASAALTLMFLAMAGAIFTIAQFLQFGLGYTPLAAGFALLPAAGGMLVGSHLGGHAGARLGARGAVVLGIATAAAGLALQAGYAGLDRYLPTGAGLALFGLGMGVAMPAATESIMASVPVDKAGVGSAVNDTARELGGALGVAVLGSVLASAYRTAITPVLGSYPDIGTAAKHTIADNLGAALAAATDLGRAGTAIAEAAQQAFVHGMQRTLWVAFALALWGAVIALAHLPSRQRGEPAPQHVVEHTHH